MSDEVVFVLGGPGSGKGTMCHKLVQEFGLVHLSAGDLLRAERQSGSKNGELIESYIREGKIVPVEITIDLIEQAMAASNSKKFLIDGFPRNEDNLDGWERVVGDKATVKFCLVLECPESELESRLLNRGKSSGRSDDNVASIRKRFQTYIDSTLPIIHRFESKNMLQRIDSNRPVDEVYASCRALFQ